MTARERSRELQQARKQKILEEVHRTLYYDKQWDEHEVYGRRFRKIIERSELHEVPINADDGVVDEFKRRVLRVLKGKDPLDKSLIYYRIIMCICDGPGSVAHIASHLDDNSEDGIMKNIMYLEKAGLIIKNAEEYALSITARKLYNKSKG